MITDSVTPALFCLLFIFFSVLLSIIVCLQIEEKTKGRTGHFEVSVNGELIHSKKVNTNKSI